MSVTYPWIIQMRSGREAGAFELPIPAAQSPWIVICCRGQTS